jgi:hypothetical protein
MHGLHSRACLAPTALSAPALRLEIYFEHYKGSFGDKWMWTPRSCDGLDMRLWL